MKRLAVVFTAVASVLLILIIVFGSLTTVINDETFINNEFTVLGTAKQMNMNNSDLVRATMRLISYMQGKADSIDIDVSVNGETVSMFTLEQEHSHMADVQTLFLTIRQYRDYAIVGMLILLLLSVVMTFKTALHTLAKGYLYGTFVCALGLGFIGVWAAMDFSSFWTMFHEALFWNDDWLFNPTESRMINMLPEEMFAAIIGRMALIAVAVILILAGASIAALIVLRRKDVQAEQMKQKRRERVARQKAGLPPEDQEEDEPAKKKPTREEKAKLRRQEQLRKQRDAEREKKRKRVEKARAAKAEAALEAEKAEKARRAKARRAAARQARQERDQNQRGQAPSHRAASPLSLQPEETSPSREEGEKPSPGRNTSRPTARRRPVQDQPAPSKRKKNQPFELDIDHLEPLEPEDGSSQDGPDDSL